MTVKARDLGTLRRTRTSRAGETANAKSRAMAKGTRIGRDQLEEDAEEEEDDDADGDPEPAVRVHATSRPLIIAKIGQ